MPPVNELLEPLPAFLLVLTRIAGLLMFLPLVSSRMVPAKFKVLMSVMFAAMVFPNVPLPEAELRFDILDLGPLLASEMLVGISVGVVATVPLMTAQVAGTIMGQQMGLGLAQIFNPAVDIQGDNIGQSLFFAAMAGFLVSGGLEALYIVLLTTFENVPLAGFGFRQTPLDLLLGVVASGFDVALRVALPVVVILVVESIIVGFIMRTIPTINIMVFGFPIKILAGLFITITAFVVMVDVILKEIGLTIYALQDWAQSL